MGLLEFSAKSKRKFQSELDDPRITRLSHLPKRRAEAERVWVQELRVIEGVEKFRAEFQRAALGDLEAFQD